MSGHPIVACYRGLDSADAVQLGGRLAALVGEPLVLAMAYRYEPMGLSARPLPSSDNARRADAAGAALERARLFVDDAVELRAEIVPSMHVPEALVDLALELDAGALVVGRDTRGRVTRAVIGRTPCPVVVAPLSAALPEAPAITRIGVAFDGSPTARFALLVTASIAAASGAVAELLVVAPTLERAEALVQTGRGALGDEFAGEVRALVGDPATRLVEASRDLDLLVCGSRGRGRALTAVLGSVSAQLVTLAQCPVVVVPPKVERDGGPFGLTSSLGRA